MKTFIYLAKIEAGNNSFDKNGNTNMFVSPLAGEHPDRYKISGTVAMNSNIEPGTFIVSCQWSPRPDEDYDQFDFSILSPVSGLEILDAQSKLGDAKLINTGRSTDSAVDTQVSDTENKAKKIEIPE